MAVGWVGRVERHHLLQQRGVSIRITTTPAGNTATTVRPDAAEAGGIYSDSKTAGLTADCVAKQIGQDCS